MIAIAANAGIRWVWSASIASMTPTLFLKRALAEDRLGRILQADAYVKWFRSCRILQSSNERELDSGRRGCAHQSSDSPGGFCCWHLIGSVTRVFGEWQLVAAMRSSRKICSHCTLRYASGATGILQCSKAMWRAIPSASRSWSEGIAIVTWAKLTPWDVADDSGEDHRFQHRTARGPRIQWRFQQYSSIRQFLDFPAACREGRAPVSSGVDGRGRFSLFLPRMNRAVLLNR